jgi:hypothetical protein
MWRHFHRVGDYVNKGGVGLSLAWPPPLWVGKSLSTSMPALPFLGFALDAFPLSPYHLSW